MPLKPIFKKGPAKKVSNIWSLFRLELVYNAEKYQNFTCKTTCIHGEMRILYDADIFYSVSEVIMQISFVIDHY